jgi:hypothetical protein
VLFHDRPVQAQPRFALHIVQAPRHSAVRLRPLREDLDPPLELRSCDLLRDSRNVHTLAGTYRHLRIEDHDADLRSRRDVARMCRIWRRNPVELGIAGAREIDRGGPGASDLVGGGQHHVQIGIDDAPSDSSPIVSCHVPAPPGGLGGSNSPMRYSRSNLATLSRSIRGAWRRERDHSPPRSTWYAS